MPALLLADFGVIILALGLFIFFWAALPLIVATGEGLAQIVRGFPAIGDDLADWIRSRTRDVERVVQNTMQSYVHAGTQTFVNAMDQYADNSRYNDWSIRSTMYSIAAAVYRVAHAQQHQVTQPVVDTVNHTVTNNVENTNNYITQVVGVNQQYVDETYNTLASWADTAVHTVYSDVVDADNAITTLATWTEGQISNANTYAAAIADYARTSAVSEANDHTDSAFTTLEAYVSDTVDWVQSTRAIDRDWTQQTVNKGIDDVTGIAAGMTALVMENVIPRVVEVEQDIEKCVRPLCDNGLDFIKGLGQLSDILSTVALFGLIVEAVTDPEGTGKAIAHEVDEITAVPRELFSAITGIGK